MAKARKESSRPGELREEVRLRREMARLQAEQVRLARRALATYRAAENGRGNRDWRASAASADAAIIPDATTLNARARQCVRDSWIGRSAVRAFSRNVVGCGIMPVPLARDGQERFMRVLNARILKLFWRWASDRNLCDVEKRQSFWQKQSLMVEERVTVGESFLVWSYAPSDEPDTVGLRLQSFESEQLDLRLQSWTDPATGQVRQVRGGVEVDEWGAPTAYHFYTRNPADYLPVTWQSVRIPAARVFHYFKQERVLQVRGVTQLAPILQDVRDFNRFREATLWRAIMEACIGGVIKKEFPGPAGNMLNFGQTGSPATTGQGKRTVDYTPGMVVELSPQESFEPFLPSTPGNQYDPYTKTTLRGIGAGIGLSYSQVARQSEGNYSAARQDMLEDRKEFEPEQEMLAHNVVLPIYQLFVRLAFAEGHFDALVTGSQFAAEPRRFLEAEYVAPAAPWIDPNNEAQAYEKLIKLKVMDRDEIAHLRGRRLSDIWDKIESEQELAADKGIELPEDVEAKTAMAQAQASQANVVMPRQAGGGVSVEWLKRMADAYGVAVRSGLITPQPQDEQTFRRIAELPSLGDPETAWENPRRPVTLQPDAEPESAPMDPDDPNASDGDETGDNGEENTQDTQSGKKSVSLKVLSEPAKPQRPPGYRDGDPAVCCGTCSYLSGQQCTRFQAAIELSKTCDDWASRPVSRDEEGTGRQRLAPWTPDGQRPLDMQFEPSAARRDVGDIGPS